MTRDDAMALVRRIMDGDYADDVELHGWLDALSRTFGCPSGYVADLIFRPSAGEPTPAEVIGQAVAYRPIAL